MLEKARDQLGRVKWQQYAAEVAEHKRDLYLVEEIVKDGGTNVFHRHLGIAVRSLAAAQASMKNWV